jgi:UDPglucose--hexose-1-phosphate uridylyltransferase
MSEYRYQPLTDQWILIAGNREQRPNDYAQSQTVSHTRPCPFCLGHESETPEAIVTYPQAPTGEWSVRVFANKYPALFPVPNEPRQELGPYASFRGHGQHELMVLSPRHVESFSELTPEERHLSLLAFQQRLVRTYEEPKIAHAVVFQNCRLDAGASIQHVHCQLIGTTLVPPSISRVAQRQQQYQTQHGQSLLHAIACTEREAGCRVIAETEYFQAFCPYASRQPYETWVTPKVPDDCCSFFLLSQTHLNELSELIQQVITRLEKLFPQIAYNTILHLPPKSAAWKEQRGNWYAEIFPRLNKTAGFEWATGCMINQVAPEIAAERLKSNAASP